MDEPNALVANPPQLASGSTGFRIEIEVSEASTYGLDWSQNDFEIASSNSFAEAQKRRKDLLNLNGTTSAKVATVLDF